MHTGKYGLKKHLTGCSQYCADYGEQSDPEVLRYISLVRAHLLCPGCNQWFQGQHQAQKHARSNRNKSNEYAAVGALAGPGEASFAISRVDGDLADTSSTGTVSVGLGLNLTPDSLNGSDALAAIDFGAQEAFDFADGSGPSTYQVGRFDSYSWAPQNDDSLDQEYSTPSFQFLEHDSMQAGW
jgi:hypothetical protein